MRRIRNIFTSQE